MQGQNRSGLKDIIIGAQPPLKREEKQMARAAPCFGKASEQGHFKTPRVQTASRHPYWQRLNSKAMSQPLYRGSCSPQVLTLSTSESLCLFPYHMQQSYLKRRYDLSSDVSGWQRGGADSNFKSPLRMIHHTSLAIILSCAAGITMKVLLQMFTLSTLVFTPFMSVEK